MAKNAVFGAYDQWSMVVIYDPKTGHIIHSHEVVTARGGTHPDQATMQKQAAEYLSRGRNLSANGMAFLHVDPRDLELEDFYVVDLQTKSLKAVPAAKP